LNGKKNLLGVLNPTSSGNEALRISEQEESTARDKEHRSKGCQQD
jgi:hypothetical protein